MSPEEAAREAEEKQRGKEKEKQRVSSWNSVGRRSTSNNSTAGPPTHPPPAPPIRGSGAKSPQEEETIRRAEHIAQKSERHGHNEHGIPEITIRTSGSAGEGIFPSVATATGSSLGAAVSQITHGRDSTNQPVLPVVRETGEGSANGQRYHGASRVNQYSSRTGEPDRRPMTPAKDGQERNAGFGNPIMSNTREPIRGPPTPPKTAGSIVGNGNSLSKRLTKPESADSGIGVSAPGRERSGSQRSYASGKAGFKGQMGRESMDKALPPLPGVNGPAFN